MFMAKDKISNLKLFIALFVVCLCLYSNGLNNDFILDDNFLITNNAYVKNFHVSSIFTTGIFHFKPKESTADSYYYRPFQSLSYSLEYLLWGGRPAGYRISNILLHSLNSLFVFLLVYLILNDKILAFSSGVFFCIHPAQVCLVTFIAGRSNLLETFFILLSILAYIRWLKDSRKRFYYFSLLLYVGALFSREGALLSPLYLIVCAMFLKTKKNKIFLSILPYIVLGLLYFTLRNMFLPSDSLKILAPLSLNQSLNFLLRLQDYFWQLILPLNLKVALFNKHDVIKLVFYFLSSLIFVYFLTRAAIHKNKAIILGLIMYFVGLIPLLKLDKSLDYFGPVLSEHYVYNASIGFCIILAFYILRLYNNYPRTGETVFVMICLFFSAWTVTSGLYYKNELSFYRYVLSVDEHNSIARINLGNVYYAQKAYGQAINEANKVLQLEPGAWDAYILTGNVFRAEGKPKEAMESYRRALVFNPDSDIALNNIGLIYKEQNKYRESLEAFDKALAINPESLVALENMAGLLIKNKAYVQALAVCKRMLALDPHNVKGLVAMGVYWAESGYPKEAEFFLKEVLRLNPLEYKVMENIGAMYGNTGEIDKAVFYFEKALKINPLDPGLKKSLEKALMLKKQAGQ